MKWLIGTACVAVIAASGIYLSGQYKAHAAELVATTAQKNIRADLFRFFGAQPSAITKVVSGCRAALNAPELFDGDTARQIVSWCRAARIDFD